MTPSNSTSVICDTNNNIQQPSHQELANAIRFLSADAVQNANSGHPGMPMGMADVMTVLLHRFLKFDPKQPQWPDRDRFILSAGHGSMLQYAAMYLTGYEDITLEEIKNFRQLGAKTAGHPEFGHTAGIETTTGPLGQGVANAVGMALAERMLASRFGSNIVDHYTYVIAGDGCLMEGIAQEAISLAGHFKLGRLILLWDDNNITIDGAVGITDSTDQLARFAACGWDVAAIDGHNPQEIANAIANAQKTDTPSLIACRTTIGYGAPNKAGSSSCHGAPLGIEEIQGARKQLNWPYEPFVVPEHILNCWRSIGNKGAVAAEAWQQRLEQHPNKEEFIRMITGELPENWHESILNHKQELANKPQAEATRKSSGKILEKLTEEIPALIGGSADLTGSVNTKTSKMHSITAADYSQRYINWGIREHAMAAAMNGIALHGGFIPYAGTFMVFTDYCKPAIRLSALMKQRVIYVMTHDSIGLGEDGPTHQPIEHLATIRAIPDIKLMRPCDGTETAECWALALADKSSPSVLSLTRQSVPALRTKFTEHNLCAKGAYVISDSTLTNHTTDDSVTIIGTGSEVAIAVAAQKILESNHGIATKVISMPCWELFEQQTQSYKNTILGSGLRVAIEAACSFGWEKWIGADGIFIGMQSFGASAPAQDLYQHFGITAEIAVKRILQKLGK